MKFRLTPENYERLDSLREKAKLTCSIPHLTNVILSHALQEEELVNEVVQKLRNKRIITVTVKSSKLLRTNDNKYLALDNDPKF